VNTDPLVINHQLDGPRVSPAGLCNHHTGELREQFMPLIWHIRMIYCSCFSFLRDIFKAVFFTFVFIASFCSNEVSLVTVIFSKLCGVGSSWKKE